MRRLASLAPLALLVAACGGGSSQPHSVLQVSKAFSDAGIPFTTELTGNPYVNGQAVFLPGSLNSGPLESTVQAGLSEVGAFDGIDAWVFDTDAHAAAALKAVPLAHWLPSNTGAVRVHDGNVIVVASGFTGADKTKLDAALAALR